MLILHYNHVFGTDLVLFMVGFVFGMDWDNAVAVNAEFLHQVSREPITTRLIFWKLQFWLGYSVTLYGELITTCFEIKGSLLTWWEPVTLLVVTGYHLSFLKKY